MIRLVILFATVIQCVIPASFADDLIVALPDGQIKGTTYVTPKNTTYYGFQGIPYAAAPVGKLRFEAPQPPQPWDGIRDATQDGKCCLSNDSVSYLESEDCLFINVYTPSLKPLEKLPVMLWIYGGQFSKGSSLKLMYGPDFLIDEDIIMVSFNYRIGPFGFLSTGDVAIPGNAGLKDQSLAIKWTYDNIAYFGGDPKKITIFGESAGGSSVGLQLVTQLSAGLFRAAIAESGTTIASFSIDENPKAYADLLATTLSLGSYVNDTQRLKQLLQELPAEEINNAAMSLSHQSYQGWPVIEAENEHAFLTESPYVLLENGRFNQVPVVVGVTTNEAVFLLGGTPGDIKNVEQAGQGYDYSPESLIPQNLHQNASNNGAIIKSIQNMYLKGGGNFTTNAMATTQYFSDNVFVRGAIKHAELASKYVPVYLYQFAYYGRSTLSTLIIDGIKQATHCAELPFLFNSIVFVSNSTIPEDLLMQDRMVKLWTNFAKYLDPTPEKSKIINVTWPKYSPDEAQFLNINNTLKVQSSLRKTYSEWTRIYETYGRKPFITF